MSSIYKRGLRYWVAYKDPQTGKRVQKSVGKTRAEAVTFLRERGQVRRGKICLKIVLDAYCKNQEIRSKSSSVEQAWVASGHLLRLLVYVVEPTWTMDGFC